MARYYTPTADEFYLGFEYDMVVNWRIENGIKIDTWETRNTINSLMGIDNLGYNEIIRVKYLDEEDIKNVFNITKQINRKDGLCTYYFDGGKLSVNYLKNNVKIYKGSPINWELVFDGSLKNKSELIKVLTWTKLK